MGKHDEPRSDHDPLPGLRTAGAVQREQRDVVHSLQEGHRSIGKRANMMDRPQYTTAECISMDDDVCRAYDTACDLAVSIEAPQLCVDIYVFVDGSKLQFEARRMTVLW
ncbi:hypothetical protein [Burkholderia vietnamiensis]|uniref:hypothetical protein n=1 Tax=Burkholderia vietnamiensis TaxID=60552 RepID=UPI001B94F8C2|nr:hypothetical protein [Burkholderia vietnamiensis]MBR8219392.1 hypothetical protein [Burkholderia vietnamiensis]